MAHKTDDGRYGKGRPWLKHKKAVVGKVVSVGARVHTPAAGDDQQVEIDLITKEEGIVEEVEEVEVVEEVKEETVVFTCSDGTTVKEIAATTFELGKYGT